MNARGHTGWLKRVYRGVLLCLLFGISIATADKRTLDVALISSDNLHHAEVADALREHLEQLADPFQEGVDLMQARRWAEAEAAFRHVVDMADCLPQPHGNLAGIGQALQQSPELRYYQSRNEQAMVHTAAAFAKMTNRLQTLGFSVEKEKLNELFVKFKALADRKKSVYDEDIEALVLGTEHSGPWHLDAISIHTDGTATERHWMPEGSDCPHPAVIHSIKFRTHSLALLSKCHQPIGRIRRDCRQSIRFSWPPMPFDGSQGPLEEMAVGPRSAPPLPTSDVHPKHLRRLMVSSGNRERNLSY